jgi:hypothetical protein
VATKQIWSRLVQRSRNTGTGPGSRTWFSSKRDQIFVASKRWSETCRGAPSALTCHCVSPHAPQKSPQNFWSFLKHTKFCNICDHTGRLMIVFKFCECLVDSHLLIPDLAGLKNFEPKLAGLKTQMLWNHWSSERDHTKISYSWCNCRYLYIQNRWMGNVKEPPNHQSDHPSASREPSSCILDWHIFSMQCFTVTNGNNTTVCLIFELFILNSQQCI